MDNGNRSILYDAIGAFTSIPNSVIEMWPKIGNDAICLFLYFRYRSGSTGYCYPSYETIQKNTGLTRQRISASIKTLLDNGLLERKKRFSGSSVYALKMPPIRSPLELMERRESLVTPSNCNSTPLESPLVTPLNSNKIQINKIQDDKIKNGEPVGSPPAEPSTSLGRKDRRTEATLKGDGVDMLLDTQFLRHPAMIAYREIARLHAPIPLRTRIAQEIGEDPAAIEKWKDCVLHWIGHGWNKQNIIGLLQSYASGGRAGCGSCSGTAFPPRSKPVALPAPAQPARNAPTPEEIAAFREKLSKPAPVPE